MTDAPMAGAPAITPTLLLDAISTSATFAVSTRHLRAAYAGSCLRVRRSSDNAEQDIGFSSDLLDTSSLTTFVGANDGFVTKWYDQSGNGRDFAQATAGNQPRIVTGGTIHTLNSNPAVKFIEASATFLNRGSETLTNFVSASAFTCFDSFNATTVSRTQTDFTANLHFADNGFAIFEPIGCGGSASPILMGQISSGGANKNPSVAYTVGTSVVGMSCLGDGSGNYRVYKNGGTPGSVACGSIDSSGATTFNLGACYNTSTALLDGFMQEFFLFNVSLSNADCNTLANGANIIGGGNMATYLGITWTAI